MLEMRYKRLDMLNIIREYNTLVDILLIPNEEQWAIKEVKQLFEFTLEIFHIQVFCTKFNAESDFEQKK